MSVALLSLVSLNGVALALIAAFGVVIAASPFSSPSLAEVLALVASGIPHALAIAAARKSSGSLLRGLAIAVSCLWALILLMVGVVAATGLAGLTGLLILVAPALALMAFNIVVLTRRKSRSPSA